MRFATEGDLPFYLNKVEAESVCGGLRPPQTLPRFLANIALYASLATFYLILALWTQKIPVRFRWLPVVGSMGLLVLLSAWFASGRWVA